MIAWLAQQLQAPWASSPVPVRSSSPTNHDLNDDDDFDSGVRVDMWAGASPSAPTSSAVPELTTKVRVVVVGDRGTGKSSLVRYLTEVPAATRVTAPRSADAAPVSGMIAWLAQQLQAPWASSPVTVRSSSPTNHDLNDDDDFDSGVRVDMWAGASPSAPTSSAVTELTTKVRVVVVGDRGTGKSSLVRYLTEVPAATRVTAPRSADAAPVSGSGAARGRSRAGETEPRHVFTGVRVRVRFILIPQISSHRADDVCIA
ncbi:hypothetical protein AMAG_17231 [Allomyces macrogynus ATCC 38327]|uniref:Uncharacterized protein n=1 Tax=Allomyces macrogynus (strain ATCC 38327) TaxID=578462 RepID=A0A0L0TEA0_ALLM3|nr:hypothetical protein AMAG_17231 [Allomyces macrogynus ATCC 38327]|eukprot:KNE73077.1 hypothetical protein AMAG_17231 [Allomyces macrogynus ATCC 38327]